MFFQFKGVTVSNYSQRGSTPSLQSPQVHCNPSNVVILSCGQFTNRCEPADLVNFIDGAELQEGLSQEAEQERHLQQERQLREGIGVPHIITDCAADTVSV